MNHFDNPHEEVQDSSAWMLTFADLLSLVLAFFVLLFATSSVKKPEFIEIAKSLSQRLNPLEKKESIEPNAEISIEKQEAIEARDIGYLYHIISKKVSAADLQDTLLLQNLNDRLVLSIVGEQSFVSGSVKMTPELESVMMLLAEIFSTMNNRIEILGNADSSPTSGKQFPSNWELSLARALAVGNKLRENGYPHPLSVYGRGDSVYAKLPATLSNAEKQKLARRIDIIIREDGAR